MEGARRWSLSLQDWQQLGEESPCHHLGEDDVHMITIAHEELIALDGVEGFSRSENLEGLYEITKSLSRHLSQNRERGSRLLQVVFRGAGGDDSWEFHTSYAVHLLVVCDMFKDGSGSNQCYLNMQIEQFLQEGAQSGRQFLRISGVETLHPVLENDNMPDFLVLSDPLKKGFLISSFLVIVLHMKRFDVGGKINVGIGSLPERGIKSGVERGGVTIPDQQKRRGSIWVAESEQWGLQKFSRHLLLLPAQHEKMARGSQTLWQSIAKISVPAQTPFLIRGLSGFR